MAKKRSKTARVKSKPARRPAVVKKKKPARKPRTAAPKRDPLAPVGISTGSGPSPVDVGTDLVTKFNAGQLAEIEDLWWSPSIESVEGSIRQAWRGAKAVHAKNAWWAQDHVIHGGSAEGPYVGATGFAVKFRIDVETKSTGQRETMEEVGVYTVKDGKIAREEFMSPGRSGA